MTLNYGHVPVSNEVRLRAHAGSFKPQSRVLPIYEDCKEGKVRNYVRLYSCERSVWNDVKLGLHNKPVSLLSTLTSISLTFATHQQCAILRTSIVSKDYKLPLDPRKSLNSLLWPAFQWSARPERGHRKSIVRGGFKVRRVCKKFKPGWVLKRL